MRLFRKRTPPEEVDLGVIVEMAREQGRLAAEVTALRTVVASLQNRPVASHMPEPLATEVVAALTSFSMGESGLYRYLEGQAREKSALGWKPADVIRHIAQGAQK
jgi:hypothetical protein